MKSMIETYRNCTRKSVQERIQKCQWYFFFDRRKSIKRLHPVALLKRIYHDPGNPRYKSLIQEWANDGAEFPLLAFFVLNVLNVLNKEIT